ncbi:MAG TPA: glycoside hydrolase [Sedimentisphaerales bacterium]|nr:glycoside hydrolase [Sedimentisphaerales bacterium]
MNITICQKMNTQPHSESWSRRRFLRGVGGLTLGALASGQKTLAQEGATSKKAPTLENDVLRVSLSPQDASLTVVDKRIGLVWRQQVRPGFRVALDTMNIAPTSLSTKVVGEEGTYAVILSFAKEYPHAFDLQLEMPDQRYTSLPAYPFPFAAPEKNWYYVQNTSGEGILMPLEKAEEINKPFGWSGGQPWWGLTDLKRAMLARIDTFRKPDTKSDREDRTIYATPMRINYAFLTEGGYMGLAKEYRNYFLGLHPEMQPLQERIKDRPALASLKDGVYVYLWGEDPAEDLKLVTEMKAAGIERGIAVFYGRHEIDRALCDGIKQLGWVVGRYQMPTGNLFHVSNNRGWPSALLTGRLAPQKLLANSNLSAWDRVCGKQVLSSWVEKANASIRDYGVELFYFDTLVVQLVPCLHPDHPSTIEENQQARREIMRRTRELGMIVGSGEGICPTWALPDVDFFEGQMSLRTYTDTPLKIPAGGYATDLGDDYQPQAAFTLDETRRIPLYQLGFHDYVAGTWVWRDTNYQSTPFAWKKNLLNILYGTMPMWHINRRLWESRKATLVASYQNIASVRKRIGFAQMVEHGWLTTDRSVQFTDWDTGDRVIVNFGDRPFEREPKEPVPQRSFVVERAEEK